MSKIQKVTIEYNDHIREIEGKEAEKWEMNNDAVSVAYKYNNAPFQLWPINWKIVEKHPRKWKKI